MSSQVARLSRSGVLVPALAMMVAACSGSSGVGWTAIPSVENGTGASVAAVATDGTRFVAVGEVPESGNTNHAGAWYSTDGRTWAAASDQASFSERVMLSVARGPGGYMAVGNGCAAGECGGNAVWLSTDGTAWQEAAGIGPVHGIELVSVTVVAGGPGWLAGGYDLLPEATDVRPAAIWASQDGSSWVEAAVPADSDGTKLAGGVDGFALAGSRILAVGSVSPAGGHRAAAWTSTDGMTWTPVPDDPSFVDGAMDGVVAGPSTVVAVGRDGQGAAVWTSADGISWTKAPTGPGFGGAVMTAVTVRNGHFSAVGSDGGGALAWSSPDGMSWTLDASGDAYAGDKALGVAAGSTATVAVGSSRDGAAIWSAAH